MWLLAAVSRVTGGLGLPGTVLVLALTVLCPGKSHDPGKPGWLAALERRAEVEKFSPEQCTDPVVPDFQEDRYPLPVSLSRNPGPVLLVEFPERGRHLPTATW